MKGIATFSLLLTVFLASCGSQTGDLTPGNNIPQSTASNPTSDGQASADIHPQFESVTAALNSDLPGIVITDSGILENQAYKDRKKEIAANAEIFEKSNQSQITSQAICNFTLINCTTSTQWNYKGEIKGNRRLYTFVANNTSTDSTINETAQDTNSSTISGGFDLRGIQAEAGWTNSSTLTTQVTGTAKAGRTTYVYTWQVGTGGYGTQYQYPNGFSSCSQASSECISSNFSISAYRGLGYELSLF